MTEEFAGAARAQHLGRIARAYRKHPFHRGAFGRSGISQEHLGMWFGLSQAQVSRIENGPAVRNLDVLIHWARTLGIPGHLLWFKVPERASGSAGGPGGAGLGSGLAMAGGGGCGTDVDVAAMEAFRAADLRVGGGHLYASVVGYLRREVGPQLVSADGREGEVFSAAAALTEMAGWMAHDSGLDAAAEAHFRRALGLCRVGGDIFQRAHVLGSMSHLAGHAGHADKAVALARQGSMVLERSGGDGAMAARLMALEAQGMARQGDGPGCVMMLLRAERSLAGVGAERPSPWVSRFDEASMAAEASACLRRLGDWPGAMREARRVLRMRASGRVRSRAFAQVTVMSALVAEGQVDDACAVGAGLLGSAESLGSLRLVSQLREVERRLAPHRTASAVRGFLPVLRSWIESRSRLLGQPGGLTDEG